jgi:hypothetical protein
MTDKPDQTFQELFKLGLDRDLPSLLPFPDGPQFDLGASGTKVAFGAKPLGLPEWRFPDSGIPAEDESVAAIHAYHFMEHLTGEHAILLLKEVQRVLMKGGIFQFCIPWAKSEIAFQDLTHKSFYTESSFRMLMQNSYYDPSASQHQWRLKQGFLVLAGIVERNVCILGQLVKE